MDSTIIITTTLYYGVGSLPGGLTKFFPKTSKPNRLVVKQAQKLLLFLGNVGAEIAIAWHEFIFIDYMLDMNVLKNEIK